MERALIKADRIGGLKLANADKMDHGSYIGYIITEKQILIVEWKNSTNI